jgi:hypothetical protein
MDQQRIDAPVKVIDAIKRAQETINRLQAEAEAVLFGAHAALDVPAGWQWDGRGWAAPAATEEGDPPQ